MLVLLIFVVESLMEHRIDDVCLFYYSIRERSGGRDSPIIFIIVYNNKNNGRCELASNVVLSDDRDPLFLQRQIDTE